MFTFGFSNGNVGREIAFETFQEADEAAWEAWRHLTHKEKVRTTDGKEGAFFCIFKGGNSLDDCEIVTDFADVLAEEDAEEAEA